MKVFILTCNSNFIFLNLSSFCKFLKEFSKLCRCCCRNWYVTYASLSTKSFNSELKEPARNYSQFELHHREAQQMICRATNFLKSAVTYHKVILKKKLVQKGLAILVKVEQCCKVLYLRGHRQTCFNQ